MISLLSRKSAVLAASPKAVRAPAATAESTVSLVWVTLNPISNPKQSHAEAQQESQVKVT